MPVYVFLKGTKLILIAKRCFKNRQSWAVPWVKAHSACTSRSPCRWRSPDGEAGIPSLRWRPCSRCRSRWGRPGSPWSCSCSSGTPAGWASSCTVVGETTLICMGGVRSFSVFLYLTHQNIKDINTNCAWLWAKTEQRLGAPPSNPLNPCH